MALEDDQSNENANVEPVVPATAASTGGNPEGFVDLKDQVRFVVVVLFVGFAAIIVSVVFGVGALFASYISSNQESTNELKEKIIEQNAKIELLYNACTVGS